MAAAAQGVCVHWLAGRSGSAENSPTALGPSSWLWVAAAGLASLPNSDLRGQKSRHCSEGQNLGPANRHGRGGLQADRQPLWVPLALSSCEPPQGLLGHSQAWLAGEAADASPGRVPIQAPLVEVPQRLAWTFCLGSRVQREKWGESTGSCPPWGSFWLASSCPPCRGSLPHVGLQDQEAAVLPAIGTTLGLALGSPLPAASGGVGTGSGFTGPLGMLYPACGWLLWDHLQDITAPHSPARWRYQCQPRGGLGWAHSA